jgi:hypothetical protein
VTAGTVSALASWRSEASVLEPDHRRRNIMRTITFLAMGEMMLAFAISGMAKVHFGPF